MQLGGDFRRIWWVVRVALPLAIAFFLPGIVGFSIFYFRACCVLCFSHPSPVASRHIQKDNGRISPRQEILSSEVVASKRSVTASFGHYHRSGSTYVVPDLHEKKGHVDPELSCGQIFFGRQIRRRNILSTKFRQTFPDLHA